MHTPTRPHLPDPGCACQSLPTETVPAHNKLARWLSEQGTGVPARTKNHGLLATDRQRAQRVDNWVTPFLQSVPARPTTNTARATLTFPPFCFSSHTPAARNRATETGYAKATVITIRLLGKRMPQPNTANSPLCEDPPVSGVVWGALRARLPRARLRLSFMRTEAASSKWERHHSFGAFCPSWPCAKTSSSSCDGNDVVGLSAASSLMLHEWHGNVRNKCARQVAL